MKVKCNEQTIFKLHHGLDFAADDLVNQRLVTRYGLYDYLLPCECDNLLILQATIDKWNDYMNQLYKTTLFEYNPIENYNRLEDSVSTREDDLRKDLLTEQTPDGWTVTNTETPTGRKSTLKEAGYNSEDPTVTSVTELDGTVTNATVTSGIMSTTGSQEDTGTQTNTTHSEIKGNIGVMSTQQMIQMERDIIVDVLDLYVDKFAECFTIKFDYCGGL